MSKNDLHKQLINLLKELHLPMFRGYYAEFAQKAVAEDTGYAQYLFELAQRECEVRRANKIARLVKVSKLPIEKTMANFDLKRMPLKIRQQVKILLEGSFVDRTENILAFGRPGSGKTHLLCAICHELARQGKQVYFTTCDSIVQQLLRAKRDLELDKLLKRLSRFDVMMIDDFGYVKQYVYNQQSAVLKVGDYLQGSNDYRGSYRPAGAPQYSPGVECSELSSRAGLEEKR
jgi:DNA replication protein DnaC